MKMRSQPLGLGRFLDLLRAGHDQHLHAAGDLAATQHAGGAAQVRQTRELVQLPMNTTFDRLSRAVAVPASKPM